MCVFMVWFYTQVALKNVGGLNSHLRQYNCACIFASLKVELLVISLV